MLSEKLKAMRLERGMTQQELSAALGLSRSSIGMYESGRREPNFETVEKMADYFNCRLSDLIDPDTVLPSYSPDEETLLALFRRVPEGSRKLVLDMIRAALKSEG